MARKGETFPLHRLVWNNKHEALKESLRSGQHDLESKDPNNRTALRLAIILGHCECVELLLQNGAELGGPDEQGWSAVHDATGTGNARLLRLVLEKRHREQRAESQERIPQLLHMLQSDADFYLEMAWDFSSWIPLVSGLCPSDVYRIWKCGSSVRVDTTLLGYSNLRWTRGHRTFLFECKAGPSGAVDVEMRQVDHDRKVIVSATLLASTSQQPVDEEIPERLNSPIVATTMDSNAIGFARARAGIWGFQSDKTETVGDVVAKVFNVSGLEIVTKTRYEHLPRGHPARRKGKNPLSQLMAGMTGSEAAGADASACFMAPESVQDDSEGPTAMAACSREEEYFSGPGHPRPGRPLEVRASKQNFKAQLWMSEDFPLSLQRQVLPIVDLLAPTSQHIAKLRDFISMQLPAGFPVKIEIPVYHLVNARVTFSKYSPIVDPTVFAMPADYAVRTAEMENMLYENMVDDDDDVILQRVLAMSLAEASPGGAVHSPPPPAVPRVRTVSAEPWECSACTYAGNIAQLNLCEMCGTPRPGRGGPMMALTGPPIGDGDADLQRAIALSMAADDDDAALRRVLELSKLEK